MEASVSQTLGIVRHGALTQERPVMLKLSSGGTVKAAVAGLPRASLSHTVDYFCLVTTFALA